MLVPVTQLSSVHEIKVKSEVAFEIRLTTDENGRRIEAHSLRGESASEAQGWMEMIQPSRSSHGLVGAYAG